MLSRASCSPPPHHRFFLRSLWPFFPIGCPRQCLSGVCRIEVSLKSGAAWRLRTEHRVQFYRTGMSGFEGLGSLLSFTKLCPPLFIKWGLPSASCISLTAVKTEEGCGPSYGRCLSHLTFSHSVKEQVVLTDMCPLPCLLASHWTGHPCRDRQETLEQCDEV